MGEQDHSRKKIGVSSSEMLLLDCDDCLFLVFDLDVSSSFIITSAFITAAWFRDTRGCAAYLLSGVYRTLITSGRSKKPSTTTSTSEPQPVARNLALINWTLLGSSYPSVPLLTQPTAYLAAIQEFVVRRTIQHRHFHRSGKAALPTLEQVIGDKSKSNTLRMILTPGFSNTGVAPWRI